MDGSNIITFDSAYIYIDTAPDLQAKIKRMDQIIDALFTSALKAVEKGAIQEYMLDDGQTKIKTTYRSLKEVTDAITGFEKLRSLYKNRLNGRVVRAVDSKNFNNFGRGFRG